jgi:DNA helicase IV
MKNKETLLQDLIAHIKWVKGKINQRLEESKILANQSLKGFGKMDPENQAVFMNLRAHAYKRMAELSHLGSSPYFAKCKIVNEKGESKEYFFAKHEFSEESIYSWIAPIASIRFENPGPAFYKTPRGEIRKVEIKEKETYMIVDGKVLLFSKETLNNPRELIYQEHFTKQKSEFVLPEIVAQMEKAQDQVIRAHHKGPLVISGPAGSGKTTLALHRVAYLTQLPDTAELYPPDSIMVMVQDNGTKNYFSTLLPSLGINNIKITTFSEWALLMLGLTEYSYIERYGENETEKDIYEYQKLQALRESSILSYKKDVFSLLNSTYSPFLSERSQQLFNNQNNAKVLDRFDLTILLNSHFEKNKKFEIQRKYQTFINHKLVKRTEKISVSYSLIILDEFQNYLPEQISLLKKCIDDKTNSMLYVGDMAQQIKLGTIRRWDEIREIISPERNVKLNKVYRNTKNILSFIKNLGYSIEIPLELKEGPAVQEISTKNSGEEINHIKEILPKYIKGSVGIIFPDESRLLDFKKEFSNLKNVHVLTMAESQGVEFDLVCLVGLKKSFIDLATYFNLSKEHQEEIARMRKDLLYIVLTRAITELHILGETIERIG